MKFKYESDGLCSQDCPIFAPVRIGSVSCGECRFQFQHDPVAHVIDCQVDRAFDELREIARDGGWR